MVLRRPLFASAMLVALCPPAFAAKNWNEHQIIHKCERWAVGDAVNFAWVRGQPNLEGEPLWKLTSGTTMIWCGNASTDRRAIDWYWIEFEVNTGAVAASWVDFWSHHHSRSRGAVEYNNGTADYPATIAAARACNHQSWSSSRLPDRL